jgi:Phage integrase, N-terminal SAM-like domain
MTVDRGAAGKRRGFHHQAQRRAVHGSLLDRDPHGQEAQETIYGKKGEKRQDLADRLTEAIGNRSKGLVFEGDSRTLADFLDGWLEGTVKGSVKATTYESYERIIGCHIKPELGRHKLKTLAPDHV